MTDVIHMGDPITGVFDTQFEPTFWIIRDGVATVEAHASLQIASMNNGLPKLLRIEEDGVSKFIGITWATTYTRSTNTIEITARNLGSFQREHDSRRRQGFTTNTNVIDILTRITQ